MGYSIRRWADFSEPPIYRYTLGREWDRALKRLLFILLNPSTADASYDDPTNRRGVSFAKRWGYGAVVFVNLFAYRTPLPRAMKQALDPIGPANNDWIRKEVALADRVIAAWGDNGRFRRRDRVVMRMVPGMYCLGLNKNGSPKHPLYVRGDTKPVRFVAPGYARRL